MPEAPNFRLVEIKALAHAHDSLDRSQFIGIEEFVFRSELSILLDEFKTRYTAYAVDKQNGVTALYVGEFLKQDKSYIDTEIQKRLGSQGIHVTLNQIDRYLSNVSRLIRAALAQGQEISALPFTDKSYVKRGRKPLKKKRGKRRPVMVNGIPYESIAEANRATNLGYYYIQETSLKENQL